MFGLEDSAAPRLASGVSSNTKSQVIVRIAQFFVYPFSLPSLARGAETCDYIDRYYSRFEDLQEQGLDALVEQIVVQAGAWGLFKARMTEAIARGATENRIVVRPV